MNDRITALEEALAGALSAWDEHNERGHAMQGDWVYDARAALAASRAAPDCQQPDLVTADRVLALANALRNGSQADMDGVMVTVSRQACEEAADILAALDLTPAHAVGPVATNTMVEPAATPHECATEGCGKLAAVHFIRGNIGSYYCMDCYLRVHKQTHPALAAPTAQDAARVPEIAALIEDIALIAKSRAADAPEWTDNNVVTVQITIGTLRAALRAIGGDA